jgi:hypothetical protein
MTRQSVAAGMKAGVRAMKQANAAALQQAKAVNAAGRRSAAKASPHKLPGGKLPAPAVSRHGLADCVSGIAFAAAQPAPAATTSTSRPAWGRRSGCRWW